MDLAFNPDGKSLALAFGDWSRGNRFGEVQLWDLARRKLEPGERRAWLGDGDKQHEGDHPILLRHLPPGR